MKVHLDWDERYPDPKVSTSKQYSSVELEISEAEWHDWLQVLGAYDAWCAKWAYLEGEHGGRRGRGPGTASNLA